MALPRRLIAACVIAALAAPGTWLRTEVTRKVPQDIALVQLQGAAETSVPGWRVEGVWQYSASATMAFGGYSALLALGDTTLRAFSDRGYRFTFIAPDRADETPEMRRVNRQWFAEDGKNWDLWDIESATRDPATGDYWLGYEYVHSIQRFTIASAEDGGRLLGEEVDWTANSGLEAMLRLSDGRFLAVPEGSSNALLFASDPVEGGEPLRIAFENPAPGYAVTDLAQLPDGRVLLLMRSLAWGIPPFASLIAVAPAPSAASDAAWAPEVALRFDGVLPPENYEGLAVREGSGGDVVVWVISDDNLSAMQRTLVVKLAFDPEAGGG